MTIPFDAPVEAPWGDEPDVYALGVVMGGVSDPRIEPFAILGPWLATERGERAQEEAFDAMIPADLEWPDLDEWERTFGPELPYMWVQSPAELLRPQLLRHTLWMTAYRVRALGRALRTFRDDGVRYGQPLPPGIEWRISYVAPELPAATAVAETGVADLVAGDWFALPPYFPGDRTGVHLIRSRWRSLGG